MRNVFIDMPDVFLIHWMGTPYHVEVHYNGRFYTISDMDDEIVTDEKEDKILKKYFLTIKKKNDEKI